MVPEPVFGALMFCERCGNLMMFIHGHYQCVVRECDMKGVNQAPCCEGEVAG